jgi:hypothetical protein
MNDLGFDWISALRRTLRAAPWLPAAAGIALGQDSNNPAAGLAGCAACSVGLAIPIIILVLDILLLVWVARDAKARGLDNGILWMLLVFLPALSA